MELKNAIQAEVLNPHGLLWTEVLMHSEGFYKWNVGLGKKDCLKKDPVLENSPHVTASSHTAAYIMLCDCCKGMQGWAASVCLLCLIPKASGPAGLKMHYKEYTATTRQQWNLSLIQVQNLRVGVLYSSKYKGESKLWIIFRLDRVLNEPQMRSLSIHTVGSGCIAECRKYRFVRALLHVLLLCCGFHWSYLTCK